MREGRRGRKERDSSLCVGCWGSVRLLQPPHNRKNLHLSVFIPTPVGTHSPEIALLCFLFFLHVHHVFMRIKEANGDASVGRGRD